MIFNFDDLVLTDLEINLYTHYTQNRAGSFCKTCADVFISLHNYSGINIGTIYILRKL